VLGVGIDWAEEFHLVALGRPGEGVFDVSRVEHTPAGIDALVARIAGHEPDPAEVRVVLETSHGMLVERLLDAGYVVVPVNPDLVARRRGPAKKKDDAEDARIACHIALDRFERLRPLLPHGEEAAELRAIARDDERAARDERRLLNRLRADLIATFPAALAIAGDDMGRPTFLRLLQRWPSTKALVRASRDELVAFARASHHGWPERFADQVGAALAADHFVARDYLVRAKADTIALAATQLLAIGAQRRAWERRLGELLLGAPRHGRGRAPKEGEPGPVVPGGEIYLSFAGLGDRLAARVAGEIGDISNFDTPNALACYGGRAPVTRRSGKSELVVACRLACNRYLANAVQQWAFCSLRESAWAREYYDEHRARGKTHHAALRALGNRWLEVLWHCLRKGVPYDEATHVANRNRALGRAPGKAA
jgi:transposase